MKKLTKILSVTLVTAMMFSACSSSPSEERLIPEVKPGETGYLSFSLSTDRKSGTAGRNYTTVTQGTDQERLVDRLYILLYRENDNILETRIDVDVTNNSGGSLVNFTGSDKSSVSGASKNQVTTKAYPITAQKYKMVVIANPTDYITSVTDKSMPANMLTFPALKNVTTEMGNVPFNVTTIDSDLRFLMSDMRGETEVEAGDLKATSTAAESTPIPVSLARSVSKIEVMPSINFQNNMQALVNGGSIKAWRNLSWDLDVINKKSFWMRHKSVNYAGTAEIPTDDYKNLYAEDPNMGEIGSDYSANFSTLSITNTYLDTAAKTLDPVVAVYAPENTFDAVMQAAGKWQTQSTHVLIKVQIIPDNHDVGATDWTKGYYSYDGFVFTHDEAKSWIAGGPMPSISKITLAQLRSSTTFWSSGSVVTNAPAQFQTEIISEKELVFHYNSWNVYRIPVKHFDFSPEDLTKKGHYGVVRNNWYRISLNKITGPGSGSGEKHISAEVEVLDWLQRDQEEDL